MAVEPFSIEQLRLIATIDDQRSFSRAASVLGVSQPAVSQQVRGIEEVLKRRLFRRGTAGITPTIDGEAYLIYARAMLAIGEDAKRHFDTPNSAGEIRLGMTEDFARTALPGVLALFYRDHPQFKFIVTCAMSADLFKGLAEEQHDIIVGYRFEGARSGERLWSEPLVWYGREGTPTPVLEPIALAVLSAPSQAREVILNTLRRERRHWRIAFESLSFGAIEAVVQAGIGIGAFGQHFGAPGLVELGEDSGLPPLGTYDICLVQSQRTTDDSVNAFSRLIREAALLMVERDSGDALIAGNREG